MAEQKLVSEPWGFPDWITIDKSASHQLSQNEIASDNPCSRHLSGSGGKFGEQFSL